MPKTLIKSRLHYNKKQTKELNKKIKDKQSKLPPHFQTFNQKLLSGNGFIEYK